MTRPLRIAHVQPIALDIFGHEDAEWGTTVRYFLTNIAFAQARQGDAPVVHLLTSGRPFQTRVRDVDVRFHRCAQLPRSMPVTARFGRQLSWSMVMGLNARDIDVIHFHGTRSLHFMYGAVAWRARQLGIPMVSQDHGPRQGKLPERFCQEYALTRSSLIFAANSESCAQLEEQGVHRDLMRIVPNGYDPEIFFPSARPPRSPEDVLKVLVVSRLWEDKDPLTMADAVTEASRRGVRIELTVVGHGPLRAAVAAKLDGTGVAVNFIEHIAQPELASLYRSYDVLMLTSLREGYNQVTIEAMASGLPVLATDIGGVRDGVGDAGWLLPPRRPDLFADALVEIAGNPATAASLRSRGIERSANLTWDQVVLQFRAAYETAVNLHSVSAA